METVLSCRERMGEFVIERSEMVQYDISSVPLETERIEDVDMEVDDNCPVMMTCDKLKDPEIAENIG